MVGVALYSLAHIYTLLSTDPIIQHTKKCKYCKKLTNEKVQCLASHPVLYFMQLESPLGSHKLIHPGSPVRQLHQLARRARRAASLRLILHRRRADCARTCPASHHR